MGTKMGPSYANLFVGFIEHQFFSQHHGPKPELYNRYIDDWIGATSFTKEELTQFITAVISFHLALKYTWEISDTSLAFLDIKISFEGNVLCTSVYYKPTDSYKRRSLKNCEKGMEFLPCDGCEDEYMNTVVFIFTSITRQELQTFFTVSQTSPFMY